MSSVALEVDYVIAGGDWSAAIVLGAWKKFPFGPRLHGTSLNIGKTRFYYNIDCSLSVPA